MQWHSSDCHDGWCNREDAGTAQDFVNAADLSDEQ
jgi:hypothetical protein